MIPLINKLIAQRSLSLTEWEMLIASQDAEVHSYAITKARETAQQHYGKYVFVRGLIEMTNYCKNNCYYCGIRAGNCNVERYRLSLEQILECCEAGAQIGFNTFVLQGGEDRFFTLPKLIDIVTAIRAHFPDHAITLSLGEMERSAYEALYQAGANRYLLRHETANAEHYQKIHPKNLTLSQRMTALRTLKEIGFQTGSGFMVGSPHQTAATLAQDMAFLTELQPEMVGIGPFLPHEETPFKGEKAGSLSLTIYMLALTRLLLPKVLLPATTALATLHPDGREKAILAGANVVMPNLSPADVREKYLLYNNKASTGLEAIEGVHLLEKQSEKIEYQINFSRGDALSYKKI